MKYIMKRKIKKLFKHDYWLFKVNIYKLKEKAIFNSQKYYFTLHFNKTKLNNQLMII